MNDIDELERLEELYKKVIPINNVQTSEQEDQAIVDLAKKHLRSKDDRNVIPIERFRRARIKWSGLSVAAGLLVGIMLNPIKENAPSIAPPDDGHIVRMGDDVLHQQNSVKDLEADELQTLIAELVLKGEFEKAVTLIEYLTAKYPDFVTTSD